MEKFQKYSKYLGLVIAILVSVLIFLLRDKFRALETYGYLGIFLLSVLGNATIILPIPVIIAAFIGGGILNPFWVAVLVSLGASIGELTGYLAGLSGREAIEKKKELVKIRHWMHKWGLWVIFFLAAIPNFLFDLAGIVSGATKIPVYKFLMVTWAGKFVRYLIIAYLGAGSAQALEKFF